MTPKPFALETVLKVRKREEDLAQQKFLQALNRQREVEKEISMLQERQGLILDIFHKKQQEGILGVELSRFEEQIESGFSRQRSLLEVLQERKETVDRKRQILLVKSQKYKILKTLKEKQNKTWSQYLDKKESAMLDEIGILHHERKDNS